jgi:hydroxymethylpyrimidine pyrophosphatase-like HAD family hydrolase
VLRYRAVATDYDETLACGGRVPAYAIDALVRARDSGRNLILVTGRELNSLRSVFSNLDLFSMIVAENGTLLYSPANEEEEALCDAPAAEFIQALRDHAVSPLSVGRCLVATVRPNETVVSEIIRELKLNLRIIFNRESIMVLPAGKDKSTGLRIAFSRLGLNRKNVIGIGDAENDLALLRACGFPVAVANATGGLKREAQLVTAGRCGRGVVEVITRLLAADHLP